MTRSGIHPIVAPVLIGIWLLLVWSAIESANADSRDTHKALIAEAHRWASTSVEPDGQGWTVVHLAPDCFCAAPGLAETVQALKASGARTVEGASGGPGYQLVILQPDGTVVYAGGPTAPQMGLCSVTPWSAADLLKSDWLSADNQVLDASAPCTCP